MTNQKLTKIGVIGSIIAAICCFTPVLVGGLSLLGLAGVVAYLDLALIPILVLFLGILLVGLLRQRS